MSSNNPRRGSHDVSDSFSPLIFRAAIIQAGATPLSVPVEAARPPSTEILSRPNVAETKVQNWHNVHPKLLPYFYPLAKSHRIFPKGELRRLQKLLALCLRSLSLQTSFENDPVAALCKSLEQAEFSFNFWESQDEDKQAVIIVEGNRRCGDSIVCIRYIRLVLDVLNGSCAIPSPTDPIQVSTGQERATQKVQRLLDQVDDIATKPGGKEADALQSSLDILVSMLTSNNWETREVGLDNLILLTNPTKTGYNTSCAVSRILVRGGSSIHEVIQEQVLYLVCVGRWPDERDPIESLYVDDSSVGRVSNGSENYHCFALQALAQAISLFGSSSLDMRLVLQHADRIAGYPNALMERLQKLVMGARLSMHKAYWATSILTSLSQALPDIRDDVNSATVEAARDVGEECHEALKQATTRLEMTLKA